MLSKLCTNLCYIGLPSKGFKVSSTSMNSICRKTMYYPMRRIVNEDKVSWNIAWPEYRPPYYTADHLRKNCSYADPEISDGRFKPVWNAKDGIVDRRSYDNSQPIRYNVVDNYPLNPRGRTGLQGRGNLGRWGPNHAADAVVTRWKRSAGNEIVINPRNVMPILQFLAILRKDCRKWAIPGGFVDANEEAYAAMLRELFEEAIMIDKDNLPPEDWYFTAEEVYKGYVDDPRNTDNAWIETTAANLHDVTGENTRNLVLDARDDAADVKWIDISEDMNIYPTHSDIIQSVYKMHMQKLKEHL